MTLTSFLIFIICFAVLAYLAYWVITKFFPAPAQMPALAVVGLLLLLVLLAQFLPEAANYRIWR
jgi:hypothetical protein